MGADGIRFWRNLELKRYTDYSKAELAKLNEEEVKQLIELECMINGVSTFYEKPKLREVEELPKPDIEVFEVAGIKFLNHDEAMELLDVLRSSESIVFTDYDYRLGCGSSCTYVEKDKNVATISKSKHYSKEKYDSLKEAMKRKSENEKYNKEVTALYNERMKQCREFSEIVKNAVYEAISYEENYEYAKRIFERYVIMSDGNVEVAKNFFEKTEYYEFLFRILEDGGYGAGTDRE